MGVCEWDIALHLCLASEYARPRRMHLVRSSPRLPPCLPRRRRLGAFIRVLSETPKGGREWIQGVLESLKGVLESLKGEWEWLK